MSTLCRLLSWTWRAWPVLVIVLVVCGHLILRNYFPEDAECINKTASLVAQLIGGLIILYSIDSNIGIMNQKSLLSMLKSYFEEFPLIKRSVVIELRGLEVKLSGGMGKVIIGRNPQTIDEKIQYLQEQIDQIKLDIEQESKELNKKIEQQSGEMNAHIQDARSALKNIKSKMAEVSTGGVKVQLFGVLLMGFGAIAGFDT